MALETLKKVKEIGGYPVGDVDIDAPEPMPAEDWDKRPIWINHRDNRIMFKIQSGPVKEVGVNGCQVDTLIEAAKMILEGLDEKLPCTENRSAIQHLILALFALENRKKNREARGVEGTNNA